MAQKKNFKVTEEQFNLFRKICFTWLFRLGLSDWETDIFMEDTRDGMLASCAGNEDTMTASITLNSVWSVEPTNSEIKETARHEVLELLLVTLRILAEKTSSFSIVHKEVHSVIHRLLRSGAFNEDDIDDE